MLYFHAMPRTPEQPPDKEMVGTPFVLSSRFESREASQAPYDAIQTIIREQERVVDFSVFRFIQSWPESLSKAPPSNRRWYVVALGARPPEPLFIQVREAINQGELAALPDEAVVELIERRLAAIASRRPYIEKHYTLSMQRRNPNKDKVKRKMQKDSRRKNRGK